MVLVGEQRETHVRENKVLGKEIYKFKDFFSSSSRLFREVYERVVGLHYTAK